MTEFAYIRWLRQNTPSFPRVLVGPGDDAAVVDWSAGHLCLITTDVLMDGVDFVVGDVEPKLMGRKAMAVNLSDIAAMAGKPVAAVVGVVLPKNGARPLAEQLFLGLRECAEQFETALVGGDTNSWNGPLVISVTVVGEATGRGPVRRSGARPGDWLMVTGPLGGSIRGHHLNFTPRIREAQGLHERVELRAMIDISDGLSADVQHLCEESRCGAVLFADSIPISDAAREMNDDRDPLQHALGDGEDFELAFAVAPEIGQRLVHEQPVPGIRLHRIGECVDEGLWIEHGGIRQPLTPTGWVHDLP